MGNEVSSMLELPTDLPLGRRARRLFALILFLGLVFLFRELAVVGVAFVAASSGLGSLSDRFQERAKLKPKVAVGIVFGVFVVLISLLLALGISRSLHAYSELAHGGIQERIRAIRESELIQKIEAMDIDLGPLMQSLEHFAGQTLGALRLSGELLLQALIGFLIALVYCLEKEDVDRDLARIPRDGIIGTVLRYAGFLGEAVVAALKLQLAVALVNTILTALVILALQIPGEATLIALVFTLGLIPIVGNLVSGAILTVLSYVHHGIGGAIVFVVSTFLLHKLESFYLNPRLTRKHVHLPPLAIIVSLIAFEHLFGIAGLFLSFPAIYLGIKIAAHFREEKVPEAA
jgi:predicted PurR-regulated permease PerM